jgi:hypothetical protein
VTRRFLTLFLISAASLGYETALTRYFAVAKWSEYGYWIISIVMAGLALSGVVVALARPALERRQEALLTWLPVAMLVAAALGFWLATGDPFNPLQLQNPATWRPQLVDIGLYYVYLLPFFFLVGLYISLTFVQNEAQVGLVYAYDLAGAGAGALAVLGLMRILHPFALVPALLAPLALAAALRPRPSVILAALVALAAGETLLLADSHAAYNEFKAIYAPLHVPGGRVLATLRAPRGYYTLMDDFTERVDTDISNNTGLLNLPGPPTTYGVYRDGNRIAALPKPGKLDTRYAAATLAALPYVLRPHASVLLAGPSGGFRIGEALSLGAASITALEPDPVLRQAERAGWGGAPAIANDPRVHLLGRSPVAQALSGARYDIIDISADFLDESDTNAHDFTTEAIATCISALRPHGVLSIPVSIREFPAYAVRMLATVRAGLLRNGLAHPADHVVVVRSAWNVRILVRPEVWRATDIAQARKWADDRSFDVSWYTGIDIAAARAGIYNDLPAVSFERGEVAVATGEASDAVAEEAGAALQGLPTTSGHSFDLAPITEARPFYYDVLRLRHLGLILRRIEILPQAEIGPLVNVAVLAQALVLALFVLAAPAGLLLFARRRVAALNPGGVAGAAAYFAALGLGFLFIEITAIEKAAFFLNDRATAFALVLTAMLIFSGLGSLISTRVSASPRRALGLAVLVILLWCTGAVFAGDRLIEAGADWPAALRALAVVGAMAPVSVALGLPFPLGLAQTSPSRPFLLPWAWAVNGAFSVVATPLANLLALSFGFGWVLTAAMVLYGLGYLTFPARKSLACPTLSTAMPQRA